tara:strand:- start:31476 stop:34430 length:2955 start_codon:yes stop_codon:yes gene_type:complete
MKKKQLFLKLTCVVFVLVAAFNGSAQNKSITGNVTDLSGIPLPGVNVIVKGTKKGTSTDFDGNYTISVAAGQTLTFSYVGFKRKEVVVGSSSVYNLKMETDNAQLNEVIVVGYGSQKKSDITGAVGSVAKERLDMVSNTNVAQAIQGSIAGVTVNNNSASASGGDVTILIRGRNSISANNGPLIVLDGIPYSGSLNDINPVDIAAMEVLKDASASAIYGSRGANGVILVTSKKGKSGKVRFSYDGYYGVLEATNLPNVLSASEFYDFKETREPGVFDPSEIEIYESGGGVDWIDLALRSGSTLQHNLSVSGGSDKFKYYISGTLLDVKGIAVNDNFQRSTLRLNLESNATNWLTIGTNTQLSYSDSSGLGPSFSDAYYMNPLTTSYDENGDLTIYPWPEDVFYGNPLQNTLADNSNERYKVISNVYFDVDLGFIPGLSYRLNSGLEYTNTRIGSYWGVNTKRGLENQGEAQVRNDFRTNILLENIVTYKKEFGKHNVFLTGLYSFQDDLRDDQDLDSQGFPNDVLTWRQANVAALVEPGYTYQKSTVLSSMLRLNYGFDNRYIFTLTGRRDGYSAFGNSTKFGNFYSAAVAWNIHNEAFMENSGVSTLKLRGSYGENGNQAVSPYESLTQLIERSYVDGGTSLPGYVTDNELGNPSLGWETTSALNIGLDYGFLKNRIKGSIEAYQSKTTDLLTSRSISPFNGATEITTNIGEIQNEGLEFSISANAVRTDNFSWDVDANISFNRNEIVDLYGDKTDDVGNDWFIGQPIRVYYEYEYDGVWQIGDDIANGPQPDAEPGFAKVKDQLTVDTDGDGIPDATDGDINADDRIILGQRDPTTIAALSMNFSYKNFSLYILSQGAFGAIQQNGLKSDNVFGEVRRNTTKKNWWTPDNPTNEFYGNIDGANIDGVSFYESTDYWRIKDITLSYDLGQEVLDKLGIERFRLYVTGRNLFTFTDYEGLDPEFTGTRDAPLQKTFTVGFNVNF